MRRSATDAPVCPSEPASSRGCRELSANVRRHLTGLCDILDLLLSLSGAAPTPMSRASPDLSGLQLLLVLVERPALSHIDLRDEVVVLRHLARAKRRQRGGVGLDGYKTRTAPSSCGSLY